MARGKLNKLFRSFVKGLITEAGYLTYPEDASTDELNTILKRKGSRSRRLGITYEPDSTIAHINTFNETYVSNEFHWKAVANDATINLLCLQVASKVFFMDTDSVPVSDGMKAFEVDLLDYKTSDATEEQVQNTPVQMVSGKGFLFIAQEFIEPIIVEYDIDTDTIEAQPIIIQVRDFDGVQDDLANDEEPTTLSKEHYYNLRNQGWIGPGTTDVGPGGVVSVPTPPTSTGVGGWYNPWTGISGETDIP